MILQSPVKPRLALDFRRNGHYQEATTEVVLMKSQYADIAKKIKAKTAEWEKLLDPRWMRVEHVFIEGENDEDHTTLADTTANWQYGEAKIRWFLPTMLRLSDSEIEATIVHEYVHVLLSPVEERIPGKYDEMTEYAVESIARAIISVRKSST